MWLGFYYVSDSIQSDSDLVSESDSYLDLFLDSNSDSVADSDLVLDSDSDSVTNSDSS